MRLESKEGTAPPPRPGHIEYVISSPVLTGAPCGGHHHVCLIHDESKAPEWGRDLPKRRQPISVQSWDSDLGF